MRPKGSQSWAPRRPSTCCASSPRRGRKSCGSSARNCSPRCRRMLVDAHAHLDAYSDRAEVVARAKAAGLVHVVAVGQWREGAGMAGAQDAIALAEEGRSFFSATPGIHPHDAARAAQAGFVEVRRRCAGPRVPARGGCGVGFFYGRPPPRPQRPGFVRPDPPGERRNNPAYVAPPAAELARLRGLPADELAKATTENARRALRLPGGSP